MERITSLDFEVLKSSPIFAGCSKEVITDILKSLSCEIRTFSKDAYIYESGESVTRFGVVLSGRVRIENTDVWGNSQVLGVFESGEIFAEVYACNPKIPMMVDVISGSASRILFVDVQRLLSANDPNGHPSIIIKNLLMIASKKNLNLSMRIFHTSAKTIRGRLYSYFSEQISLQGKNTIDIPFDRQQLADYLGVDRSALSKELGKMRDEGLIEFKKNHFTIVDPSSDY